MGLLVKRITFFSDRSAELLTEEVTEIFKDSGRWSFAHNLAGEFRRDGSFRVHKRFRFYTTTGNYPASRLKGRIIAQAKGSICDVKASVSVQLIVMAAIFAAVGLYGLLFLPWENESVNDPAEALIASAAFAIVVPCFIIGLANVERRSLVREFERRLKLTRVGEPK